MSVTYDTTELLKLADDIDQASALARRAMYDIAMSGGFAIEGYAKNNAQQRHTRGTGTMANTIETFPKQISEGSVTVEVVVPAVSASGFPYPIAVDRGRGRVVAKKGKALAFMVGGQLVIRRSVGPYAGSHFWSDAVDSGERELPDIARDTIDMILNMLRG